MQLFLFIILPLALFFRIRLVKCLHNFVDEIRDYFHKLSDDTCLSTPDNTDIVTN